MRRHQTRRGWFAARVLSVAALGAVAVRAAEVERTGPAGVSVAASQEQGGAAASGAAEDAIRNLIERLDAPHFDTRQQATRRLAAVGAPAVPYLVDALGDGSCEIRFRARLLLSQHPSFEDVAPHLVNAVEKPAGFRARELLQERAISDFDAVSRLPHANKLFKFWGTDIDTYRDRALTRLVEAKTRTETASAVEPLLGLGAKTTRFSEAASRLESLSLAYENQYDPGFVIAQTLARGLGERHAGWVAFSGQHLQAYQQLVGELKRQNTPAHAIKKEVSDRANMSQGAARFLVDILEEKSPQRAILSQRLRLTDRYLTDEFFRALASTDPVACDRGVGRIHIADMLTAALLKWPAAPDDGVVQKLISSTTKTAVDGNKPKALSFLDALDACRELPNHGLDVRVGLGKQLGERLYQAAVEAPDNRAYYPARRLHDKFAALVDAGIPPTHEAFPRTLLERHLRGVAEATSDEQQLALERYLRILDRLRAAGLDAGQPGIKRFTRAMRDGLDARPDLVAAGVARLEQFLGPSRSPAARIDARAMDHTLGAWADQVLAPSVASEAAVGKPARQ